MNEPIRMDRNLAKASQELSYAPQFDRIIVNDNLETAQAEAERIVSAFIS